MGYSAANEPVFPIDRVRRCQQLPEGLAAQYDNAAVRSDAIGRIGLAVGKPGYGNRSGKPGNISLEPAKQRRFVQIVRPGHYRTGRVTA